MRRALLLCVAAGLVLNAGTSLGDPAKAAMDLRGIWTVVDYESSGKKIKTTTMTWEFQQNKIIRTLKTGTMTTMTFVADPTKNPKEIDLFLGSSTTGKPLKGIYQVEGDQLKVLYYGSSLKAEGKPRPTVFMTNAGDGLIMFTLQRQK